MENKKELLYTVSVSNNFIRKLYFDVELNSITKELLHYLISKIKPTDNDFNIIKFKFSDFCDTFSKSRGGYIYNSLRDSIYILNNLNGDAENICYIIDECGNKKRISILSYVNYLNNSTVELKLSEDLKPYLLGLKRNFCSFPLAYIYKFKNKYSLRLYELIKSNANLGIINYNIDTFYHSFIQTNFCDNFTNSELCRDNIIPAISDINKYSDLKVSYKLHRRFEDKKTHNPIVGITFSIRQKTTEEKAKIFEELGFEYYEYYKFLKQKEEELPF